MTSKGYYCGIDPSAGESKASGICIMDENKKVLDMGIWFKFSEIEQRLSGYHADDILIGIDGPLQPPHELGDCCFQSGISDCGHRQTTPYKGRYAEYLLNKMGYRCFVTSKNTFARKWVYRCFTLNRLCKELSFRTIEVYPTATRKILFPDLTEKKQLKTSRKKLMDKLTGCGIAFPCQSQIYTHDEMDAALAAFTVLLHDNGSGIALGNRLDGFIVLPDFKWESG